jgi:hypothetical protein
MDSLYNMGPWAVILGFPKGWLAPNLLSGASTVDEFPGSSRCGYRRCDLWSAVCGLWSVVCGPARWIYLHRSSQLLLDWIKNFAGNSEALKDSSAISFGLALLLSQQTSCR